MSAIINGSIRVDRLPKEKFIKGKDGAVYYNFTIAVQDETRYGNNVAFMDSQTKEEREAKAKREREAKEKKDQEKKENRKKLIKSQAYKTIYTALDQMMTEHPEIFDIAYSDLSQ